LEALHLGVRGIVLKDLAPEVLVRCVRAVHAGEPWLEQGVSGRALDTLLRRDAAARAAKGPLTPRELEIVRMVATGLGTGEMAKRLSISEGTVKIHLHNVYKKLGVQNRVGLVLYAQSNKLA
jgi:DNA-binding NarL/FixJ family response regulator